jgi:hypothetical protein
MATYIITMIPQLAREMGDVDTTNLYYTANQLFSSLNDGILDFSEEAVTTQYTTSGSGDSEIISPDPTDLDKRLIVLYAALVLTRGEIAKAARNSIVHSNPAGRTDLTSMVDAFEAQAERLEEKIEKIWVLRRQTAVEKEAADEAWGVELKGKPTAGEGTEAIGILNITSTES